MRELRRGRRRLWDLPPAQLRSIIRREVERRDPSRAAGRAAAARAGRHVRFHPRRDSMAGLVLHGPAEVLAATVQHLDLTARAVRYRRVGSSASSPPTLDELRHDIAVGWLTQAALGPFVTYRNHSPHGPAEGGPIPAQRHRPVVVLPRRPETRINITVADSTLLGLDELPATLHTPAGPVPIPATLASRLAHDPERATWRRILCDPSTGAATDVSRAYCPASRIAEFVRARDGYGSRFPTSTASHVELDHVVPYDLREPVRGGRTTAANLASDGLRAHHLKTDRAVSVQGDANTCLTYTTRSGRGHPSWPYEYRDPVADGPDGSDSPDDGDPPF